MLPLVCIDVDGTLVGPSGDPTQAVWDAAAAAVARGQHLAICTARGAFGKSWEYAKRLDPAGWHVFHTGAALVHTGTGEMIETPLDASQIEACAAAAAEQDWVLEHYTAQAYAVSSTSELAVAHAALMGVALPSEAPEALPGEVVRVQFVVEIEHTAAAVAAAPVGTTASAATSPIMPGAAFVSVTRDTVSKGTAIASLAARLGTTVDRVMMIGDGHNDVDAMTAAGHAVAMGNADEDCLAVADRVVADVEHDGVVEALELAATL